MADSDLKGLVLYLQKLSEWKRGERDGQGAFYDSLKRELAKKEEPVALLFGKDGEQVVVVRLLPIGGYGVRRSDGEAAGYYATEGEALSAARVEADKN